MASRKNCLLSFLVRIQNSKGMAILFSSFVPWDRVKNCADITSIPWELNCLEENTACIIRSIYVIEVVLVGSYKNQNCFLKRKNGTRWNIYKFWSSFWTRLNSFRIQILTNYEKEQVILLGNWILPNHNYMNEAAQAAQLEVCSSSLPKVLWFWWASSFVPLESFHLVVIIMLYNLANLELQ